MEFIKKRIEWILPAVIIFICFSTIIIYSIIDVKLLTGNFLVNGILMTCIITLAYPFINNLLKLHLPRYFGTVILIHVFLAYYLGSGLEFYEKISWWDLLLHGAFGFEACIVGYFILVRTNGEKINLFGFILFLTLFAMGCGALWEIIEYFTDMITGGDCQHVYDVVDGISPIADTMEDLMITFVGAMVFNVMLFIDRNTNYKICKALYLDFKK